VSPNLLSPSPPQAAQARYLKRYPTDNNRITLVRRTYYFQDIYTALQEFSRVIIPGKRLVLSIGDSYRRGITIPTSKALCALARSRCQELERRIVRKIPGRVLVSTRNKKTGRFPSTVQSDTQVYPEEYVLVFSRLT